MQSKEFRRKYPDYPATFKAFPKFSRLSFQKLSNPSRNFPDYLETFQTIRKFSRLLEIFQAIQKLSRQRETSRCNLKSFAENIQTIQQLSRLSPNFAGYLEKISGPSGNFPEIRIIPNAI